MLIILFFLVNSNLLLNKSDLEAMSHISEINEKSKSRIIILYPIFPKNDVQSKLVKILN